MPVLPKNAVQLRYPVWLRLLSAALIVLPVGTAAMVWGEGAPVEPWHNLMPWAFLGMWLALTYQVFLIELYYDEKGVTYVSPMSGVVHLSWSEIVALLYVRSVDGYVLETEDGRRIWFNDWRAGIDEFATAIRQRLPRQARGGH